MPRLRLSSAIVGIENHTFRPINTQSYFDTHWFLANVIKPKELCLHWSRRKAFIYLIYAAIIAALVCIECFLYSWCTAIIDALKYRMSLMLILSFLFFFTEPLFLLTMAFASPYPLPEGQDRGDEEANFDSIEERHMANKSIAFVVPCHKSSDVVLSTIASICHHADQRQIFIMDNGK